MTTHREKTVIYEKNQARPMEVTVESSVEHPILIPLDGPEANRRLRIEKPEILLGRDLTCDVVLHDSRCSRRHARLTYRNFMREGEPPEVLLSDLGSTNGTYVNGARAIEPRLLRDRDKLLFGSSMFGFFLRDQWELEADQKLYTLARVDALTGLLNRGVLNLELQKEFERAVRYGRSLALVMIDIDHFKRFNDTYGHPAGDFVLKELGRLVRENTRNNDIGGRYGGGELAVILPETGLPGALVQAGRLRAAIVGHPFVCEGLPLGVTVSMGVAVLEPGIELMDELVRRADRALYHAKQQGRDRVCYLHAGEFGTAA